MINNGGISAQDEMCWVDLKCFDTMVLRLDG